MACYKDQQEDFKHFCKICKKGFMCGRALGGHMKAHGVFGDENLDAGEEDPASDYWEENKKIYELRTNPNRIKTCRVCENCGKEFLSWKSFLEHGKCSSDDVESSPVWLPESSDSGDDDGHHGGRSGWSKRKRSFMLCNQSTEDEEDVALAKCLMALSNTRVDFPVEIEPVDLVCATTNSLEQRRNPIFSPVLLSTFTKPTPPLDNKAKGVATNPKGMYECKACKKLFNSHQALGGHRASHKNVKGCFAVRNDQIDDNINIAPDEDVIIPHDDLKVYQLDQGQSTGLGSVPLVEPIGRKSKDHKCSICNRIFASGQALGGHKRCHRLTSNYASDMSPLTKFNNFHEHIEQLHQRALQLPSQVPKELELNLNLGDSGNVTTGARPDSRNPARLEVSTKINLHSWSVTDQENGDGDVKEYHKHQCNSGVDYQDELNTAATMENVHDDEGDSKVKFAKLSELKYMNNVNGSSSSWLQVGIGSTTDVGPDP